MGAIGGLVDSRLPIGAVVQSPLNLEKMSNGQWLRLDGRDLNRGDYPLIQAQYPISVTTSTARTLPQALRNGIVIADDTNFIALSTTDTAVVQASPDGLTGNWQTSATWTTATVMHTLIRAGSRLVGAGSGADMAAPYVANVNQTAAAIVAKSNWTATTGGLTTTLQQGLAYGATANAGAGRTVLVKDGSVATASGIAYLNDGATAWSAASGGSTATRTCVVWTGQKFITFAGSTTTSLYQTSADGATWADAYLPFAGANVASAASDGAGTVVASGDIRTNEGLSAGGFLVSTDHGATWRIVPVPDTPTDNQNGVNRLVYVNGLFCALSNTRMVSWSRDGVVWVFEPIGQRGVNVVLRAMAYKAGVYFGGGDGTTAALTATEDGSRFRLQSTLTGSYKSAVGFFHPLTNTSVFMRVK